MAFSSSSPVRNVEVVVVTFGGRLLMDSVRWEWHDGTAWNSVSESVDGDLFSASPPAALATLQAKYAAGPLTDNDGNTVTPTLSQTFGPITTPEDLTRYGYQNPAAVR